MWDACFPAMLVCAQSWTNTYGIAPLITICHAAALQAAASTRRAASSASSRAAAAAAAAAAADAAGHGPAAGHGRPSARHGRPTPSRVGPAGVVSRRACLASWQPRLLARMLPA